MRKFLLFAIAILLGGIAFAEVWDPQPLDQLTCDFFGYPSWNSRSVKGCLTCPVYDENNHRVTCESVSAANGGVINRDCCWLNTPKDETAQGGYNNLDPILGNCYTNGCVLGPNPWSVKCICKLNCAMSDPTGECYAQCNTIQHPNQVPSGYSCLQYQGGNPGATAPNGGNGGNGGNIGHGGNTFKISHSGNGGAGAPNGGNGSTGGAKKEKKVNKTTLQKPTNPAVTAPKSVSGKQTPSLQSNDKKATK